MALLGRNEDELQALGALWTAREIAQQPAMLRKTHAVLAARKDALQRFLRPLLDGATTRIILTGAGTSAFIGECLAPYLAAKLPCRVEAIPTTDLVSAPYLYLEASTPTLLVSFGRSGDSPESVAALDLANQLVGDIHHLAITCNPEGALARRIGSAGNGMTILLPEETHDRSFAMTSSFSCMTYAALAALASEASGQRGDSIVRAHSASKDARERADDTRPEPGSSARVALSGIDGMQARVERMAQAVEAVIATQAGAMNVLAGKRYERAVYLGSHFFKGLAREAALKLLELTDGAMIAAYDSPMGFRHGPKTIVNDRTLVAIFLSNDAYTRRYDVDLLNEIQRDGRHGGLLAISARDEGVPAGVERIVIPGMADAEDVDLLVPFIVAPQIYAFEESIRRGRSPDTPNTSGTVNRVVQGVRIHAVR